MKGLKKIALASAIAAVSAGAPAELRALDAAAMGELTGRAGLTIDVEPKYTSGEFQYKDAGSLFLSNLRLGGNENEKGSENTDIANTSYLDNYRLTIDVAGSGAVEMGEIAGSAAVTGTDNAFAYGFAEVRGLGLVHASASNTDAAFAQAAGGVITATNFQAAIDVACAGAAGAAGDACVGTADLAATTAIDGKKTYGDGDLVIHFGFTDAWQKGGGLRAFANGAGTNYDGTNTGLTLNSVTFEDAIGVAARAVDFNFSIDAIGIASSDFVTGETSGDAFFTYVDPDDTNNVMVVGSDIAGGIDSDASDTVLISNLDVNGYLGPADLHISNNGNGFANELDLDSDGTNDYAFGDANSKITWGSYFNITDLDVYIDIAGVMIKGLKINNTRGDVTGLDGTAAFGFAHSIREIYAVKDDIVHVTAGLIGGNPSAPAATASLVDGIALNTRAKFDMDIDHLSFGDTNQSIGNIYFTDVETDTKWTISAH